jgi:tRNA(Arg) A34 adenosine deaminase TadA
MTYDISTDIQKNMQRVIKLSNDALLAGDEPFAAILSIPGYFEVSAQNRVVRDNSPTAHAELLVLEDANRKLAEKHDTRAIKEIMRTSVLYSSAEPCAMCCGAMYWHDIGRLLYGCANKTFRKTIRHTNTYFSCKQYFRSMNQLISIEGPILEDCALAVMKKYFMQNEKRP